MAAAINNRFSFGEFELDVERRLLFRQGEAIPLKSKAIDLLITLIEQRGEVVSKNALLDSVWENQFVEENNLTVHIAALRKVLGETKNENRYIVTVPGKGYRFVAPVFMGIGAEEEVVVERHSVERIIIDEEIVDTAVESIVIAADGDVAQIDTFARPAAFDAPSAAASYGRTAIVATAILLLAILGGVGYSFRDRLLAGFASPAPFGDHRVRQLTTNGNVGLAALSPDGKSFAFTIDDLGQKSLWLGYTEGGGDHLQLRPPAEATYSGLAFSPDGAKLFFSIKDDKNPKSALYSIPALGGVPVKLIDEISQFALSPDGRQIAVGRRLDDRDVLETVSIDGSSRVQVAAFPKDRWFVISSPSWSSDGRKLALSASRLDRTYDNDLAVADVATGEVQRFTLPEFREITRTAWLADGSGLIITAVEEDSHSSVPQYRLVHVAYPEGTTTTITEDLSNYGESWHTDAGPTLSLSARSDQMLAVEHRQLSNVWIAPADNLAAARQITFSSFGKYDGLWGLDWTPSGELIYTTSDTKSQYLSLMNSDGSGQRSLTAPGYVDSVLTVSEDGRYILFHSNRGGDFDIWRTDIDGSNPKQLTFGGNGFIPAPSIDGKWVYYKSWSRNLGELCRVPIEGGEPECLTENETTWITFSPDGKYFAGSYKTDKYRLAIFSAETNQVISQFDMAKTGTMYMGSRWTPDGKAVTYRDLSFGYWIQPVDGGEPTRLEGLPKEKLYNFSWSRDGKWLAFVRGQEIRDVVLFRRD